MKKNKVWRGMQGVGRAPLPKKILYLICIWYAILFPFLVKNQQQQQPQQW